MKTVLFVTDPYLEPLLEGAVQFAREHGWLLESGMRRSGRFISMLEPDGILATFEFAETVDRLLRYQCPVVQMLHIRDDPRVRYPTVIPHYEALGVLGARHLLQMGCPHLAFYRRFESPDSNAIRAGFETTMRAAHREVHRLDYPDEYPGQPTSGCNARVPLNEWEARLADKLRRLPKPCAIMAEDDRFGAQLIRIALASGLRVPQDIAVLGCDNQHPEVDLAPVPLSSVDSNLRGVGYLAAELLQRLMNGSPPPASPLVAMPHAVVARESTASFVCNDARVAAVVCRIRRDFAEPLSVTGLARDAGMSVRSLQSAFKDAVGHSLRDEIIRCRLERAEQLLEDTDLKLSAVAVESGLGDARSLTRFFHLKHHQTPHTFRQIARMPRRHIQP